MAEGSGSTSFGDGAMTGMAFQPDMVEHQAALIAGCWQGLEARR
jgi:hypothetical protein